MPLRPLQIGNFFGHYKGKTDPMTDGGQATYEGDIFVAMLPSQVVKQALPSGFDLAARNDTATDHPIIVMLGWQRQCRVVNGGMVTLPTPEQEDYKELIVIVPYVVARSSPNALWHNFSVRMFLSEFNPVIIGDLLFQYSKGLGSFTPTGVLGFPGEEVRDEFQALAFSCALTQTPTFGPAGAPTPGFADFMTVMEMPILGVQYPGPRPPPTCSYFEWDPSSAQVAAMDGGYFQFRTQFRPGMTDWVQSAAQWTRADAQASFSVRNIRWRLALALPGCHF